MLSAAFSQGHTEDHHPSILFFSLLIDITACSFLKNGTPDMSTSCRTCVARKTKEKSVDKKWNWSWPWSRSSKTKSGQIPLTEENLKVWLRGFDTNGDGRLSKEELKNALESLGSTFPAWRSWRALYHADENGDGYISEDELDGLVKYILKRGYSPSN